MRNFWIFREKNNDKKTDKAKKLGGFNRSLITHRKISFDAPLSSSILLTYNEAADKCDSNGEKSNSR